MSECPRAGFVSPRASAFRRLLPGGYGHLAEMLLEDGFDLGRVLIDRDELVDPFILRVLCANDPLNREALLDVIEDQRRVRIDVELLEGRGVALSQVHIV